MFPGEPFDYTKVDGGFKPEKKKKKKKKKGKNVGNKGKKKVRASARLPARGEGHLDFIPALVPRPKTTHSAPSS